METDGPQLGPPSEPPWDPRPLPSLLRFPTPCGKTVTSATPTNGRCARPGAPSVGFSGDGSLPRPTRTLWWPGRRTRVPGYWVSSCSDLRRETAAPRFALNPLGLGAGWLRGPSQVALAAGAVSPGGTSEVCPLGSWSSGVGRGEASSLTSGNSKHASSRHHPTPWWSLPVKEGGCLS